MADDDFPQEPSHESEPVKRDNGALLEGTAHNHPEDSGEGRDRELEDGAEPDLWGKQSALIEEDELGGLKLEGFEDNLVPKVLDAMGDDAAEPLQDNPGGTSATGSVGGPDHGGFPERK